MESAILKTPAKALMAVLLLGVLSTTAPRSSASFLYDADAAAPASGPEDGAFDTVVPTAGAHASAAAPGEEPHAPSATTEEIIAVFAVALFLLVGIASWFERPTVRRREKSAAARRRRTS